MMSIILSKKSSPEPTTGGPSFYFAFEVKPRKKRKSPNGNKTGRKPEIKKVGNTRKLKTSKDRK
jgi:hypothetical protein